MIFRHQNSKPQNFTKNLFYFLKIYKIKLLGSICFVNSPIKFNLYFTLNQILILFLWTFQKFPF